MTPTLMNLPKELRYAIYREADWAGAIANAPYSTFEIPSSLAAIVKPQKPRQVGKEELEDTTSTQSNLMSVAYSMVSTPPSVVTFPMAFTCKQALAEHMEEYRHHTGEEARIAFVFDDHASFATCGVAKTADTAPETDGDYYGHVITMLLKGELAHRTCVRMRCDFTNPTENIKPGRFRPYLALCQNVQEVEFKIAVTEFSKEPTLLACLNLCNQLLTGANAPRGVSVAWPDMKPSMFSARLADSEPTPEDQNGKNLGPVTASWDADQAELDRTEYAMRTSGSLDRSWKQLRATEIRYFLVLKWFKTRQEHGNL